MPGPLGAPAGEDLIKLWAETRAGLFDENGAYEGKKSRYTGRAVPRISFTQAEMYYAFWQSVWKRLSQNLIDAGRPTASISSAGWDATRRFTSWASRYGAQSRYKYLSFEAADQLYNILGRFVNELDAGVWYGYNTDTDWENAVESLSWAWASAPERIKVAAKKTIDAIAEASGDLWWLVKWGSIALVGAYAYQIATKAKKESP
jgi:hypothetical protein